MHPARDYYNSGYSSRFVRTDSTGDSGIGGLTRPSSINSSLSSSTVSLANSVVGEPAAANGVRTYKPASRSNSRNLFDNNGASNYSTFPSANRDGSGSLETNFVILSKRELFVVKNFRITLRDNFLSAPKR